MLQACTEETSTAINMLQLYGESYERDSLVPVPHDPSLPEKQVSLNVLPLEYTLSYLIWAYYIFTSFQEFPICQRASEFLPNFHALHHFKYNLYKRCKAKVELHSVFITFTVFLIYFLI